MYPNWVPTLQESYKLSLEKWTAVPISSGVFTWAVLPYGIFAHNKNKTVLKYWKGLEWKQLVYFISYLGKYFIAIWYVFAVLTCHTN
jgi:hypothetical protein